jgi:Putative DNA-binding domain
MRHEGSHADFTRALLRRSAPPASLRLAHQGAALELRFGVYRNNVRSSLIAAVRARFPAVVSLFGDAFFDGLAGEYVCAHPPASPVMLEYGATFSDFLARVPEAQDVPYAADVARLEWAMHEALYAADAEPATLQDLTRIPVERLGDAALALHPAVRLVSSDYPVLSIWRAATSVAPPENAEFSGAEHVLIARPGLSVHGSAIMPGAFAFLSALADGAALGAAAAAAGDDFDLAATLAHAFAAGAIGAVLTHNT